MMTPMQKSLVQRSFERIVPIADTAAALFYGRLFELDPALRGLFKNDMQEQGRKLMTMIGLAVQRLDQLETLGPTLADLGRRHIAYGVRDADYATVAQALLWTLEQGLGDDFTPELREAWTIVYGVLAGAMQGGAQDTVLASHAAGE